MGGVDASLVMAEMRADPGCSFWCFAEIMAAAFQNFAEFIREWWGIAFGNADSSLHHCDGVDRASLRETWNCGESRFELVVDHGAEVFGAAVFTKFGRSAFRTDPECMGVGDFAEQVLKCCSDRGVVRIECQIKPSQIAATARVGGGRGC